MISIERLADGSFEAVADVVVGVDAREVRVPMGPSVTSIEPGGLRNTPVVVLTSETLLPVVEAGAGRSGSAVVAIVGSSSTPVGAALLEAADAADVLAVPATARAASDAMISARALGGRPLPVVPFDEPETARSMLDACWIDLDIAIPALEGPRRNEVRRVAGTLGLFARHHVVEVDPRPGFDGPSGRPHGLHAMAAAATGVLAGRIAAGNRRWH